MGMANSKQKGEGLHFRLRSRAYAAFDPDSGKHIAFVSLDAGMGGQVVTNRVVSELKQRLPGVYSELNVCISGTHTHSGPSGFLQDVIFQFAGSGWEPQTIDAMVKGVVESIVMAHANLQPATAFINKGTVDGANINRSPSAYLLNPAAERSKYEHNTDHEMLLLKLVAESDNSALGSINWFAVHPTSMNNTNKLVSGDNKGYASYLFEKQMNAPTARPGQGGFVSAFAATNLGDVSPNTLGPHCQDTGLPCDFNTSTCNGRTELCTAVGPGKDMFDSTKIIATKQYEVAKNLYDSATTALVGGVDYRHTYVTMPGLVVAKRDGSSGTGTLCDAAMGDSFAAGTIDGPGMFDFTQGNSSNPLWNILGSVLHQSTPEQKACQHPKPILLPTGSVSIPHA
jgi:neutral ceramidase